MKYITILFSAVAAQCFASVPLRWTVETSRVQPAVFDVVHGESIELEASMQSYGKPLSMAGKSVSIFWQTNGMDTAWWSAPAQVRTGRSTTTGAATPTNVLAATFTPAMDPCAATVTGFLGATGDIYRAAFTLRFRKGPGATPNVIEQPPRVLDLAHTVVINPPWPTQADFTATTTVMKAELKGYIDSEIEGAGLVTPQSVTNAAGTVTSNVVTKAYVESLGIESGLDTGAVAAVITNHVTSGYLCTVASADNKFVSHDSEGQISSPYEVTVPWIYTGGLKVLSFGRFDNFGLHFLISADIVNENGSLFDFYDSNGNKSRLTVDGSPVATSNMVDVIVSPISQSLSSKADSSSVNALQSQVSAIGAHLNAEDAHFVSTNYDSVVRMPEAYVEIKMSNTWITIWKEMTRWNRFAGTNFNWDTWGNFKTWSENVTAELWNKADRAWGAYDSETGGYSPEGYTQISSSNILIAAGMSYQRTITTGGAVWVLQCNQGTAHIGGDTNGFFRIKDGDGVTQFEVVKGNKQEMGADATGITVNNSTTPPTLTIPYSVEAADHPTIQVCTDLALADWQAEDNASCAANVSWSGQSGAWVATVQAKASPAPKLFVKATYMSGGETYIHNVAPVGMDAIILNGTKYYLGTATISGQTVLTLSTTAPSP